MYIQGIDKVNNTILLCPQFIVSPFNPFVPMKPKKQLPFTKHCYIALFLSVSYFGVHLIVALVRSIF